MENMMHMILDLQVFQDLQVLYTMWKHYDVRTLVYSIYYENV